MLISKHKEQKMLLEEFNEYERSLEDISYKSENNYFVKRSDDVTLYYFKNGNRTVLEIPKLHIYCEKVSCKTICFHKDI